MIDCGPAGSSPAAGAAARAAIVNLRAVAHAARAAARAAGVAAARWQHVACAVLCCTLELRARIWTCTFVFVDEGRVWGMERVAAVEAQMLMISVLY